jgi:hypothetical protein
LRKLLTPGYVDRSRSTFIVRKSVQVVQPFAVSYRYISIVTKKLSLAVTKLGHINVVSATVENKQSASKHQVQIDDLQLYLYDNGGSSMLPQVPNATTTKRREKIQDYFKVTIPKVFLLFSENSEN